MGDFLIVLAFYYACNRSATEALLTEPELSACLTAYETVKVSFLSDAERGELLTLPHTHRQPLMSQAYLRFKAWEKANPGIVKPLQAGEPLAQN